MNKPLKRLPPKSSDLTQRLDNSQDWTRQADAPIGALPWESADPRVKVGYSLRLPDALHLKLKFLVEHEPNTSMHKMILDGIEAEVERRLKKYLKAEE